MIFFMNQNLTKQKKEEGILVYSSSQTLFTWIVLSFPFLCFFPIYVFLLSIFSNFFNRVILDLFGIELHIFLNLFLWGYVSLITWTTSLTWFTWVFLPFPDCFFFFNFILEYWVDSELGFLICFSLNSMRLSSCHDSGHEFSMLT